MKLQTRFRPIASWMNYIAHDDPAVAMANTIALAVGSNLPLYPFYMLALLGWHVFPRCLLAAIVSPAFLILPWLARNFWSGRAARMALPAAGMINTLWCLKLLGPATMLALFLLPCALLAALLFRRGEKGLGFVLASLALMLYFVSPAILGAPIMMLTSRDAHEMSILNAASVATLIWLMALQFSGLLAELSGN